MALALFAAHASTPSGWKWDKHGVARANSGSPQGWSWNSLPTGWSWNEAEVVSTGSQVTVAGDDSTVAVAAPAGADADVGDTIAVVGSNDNTYLGFKTDGGDVVWTALGWSWND